MNGLSPQPVNWLGIASGQGWLVGVERRVGCLDLGEEISPSSGGEKNHEEDWKPVFKKPGKKNMSVLSVKDADWKERLTAGMIGTMGWQRKDEEEVKEKKKRKGKEEREGERGHGKPDMKAPLERLLAPSRSFKGRERVAGYDVFD